MTIFKARASWKPKVGNIEDIKIMKRIWEMNAMVAQYHSRKAAKKEVTMLEKRINEMQVRIVSMIDFSRKNPQK